MNNLRLLAGWLCAVLLSGGACSYAQTPLTLEQIFESAELNSSQLRPYFKSQLEADKDIEIAKDARLPEIDATMSVSFIGDGFTTKRNFTDYQRAPIPHLGTGLSVGINQPLYTGGAITAGIELSELKSSATRFATDLCRDNLRFQLTAFYLDIYKFHNLRNVIDNNLLAAKKILSNMEARYKEGTVLKNDITRYELLVSNLEFQRTKINNTLAILNNNLTTLAGLPQSTSIIPDSTILSKSLPVESVDWWLNEAQVNSPTLRLARNGIEMSQKSEKLALSEKLPKIGINAGWTMDGPILVEIPPINRNLSYWYVGVGVKYNLSSLYKSNKSVEKSRLATAKAQDELQSATDNIGMAVRADYIKYMEAYEQLKTFNKNVELADRNYKVISTRFSEGMALITDMLDAANECLSSQQQLVDGQIDIIYYYYKLLFTTGKI